MLKSVFIFVFMKYTVEIISGNQLGKKIESWVPLYEKDK